MAFLLSRRMRREGALILVFPQRPVDGLREQHYADGLVLTEWKVTHDGDDPLKKFAEAREQAKFYTQGVLAGIELTTVRYAVVVSSQYVDRPADAQVGTAVYRHINIATDPETPAKAARIRNAPEVADRDLSVISRYDAPETCRSLEVRHQPERAWRAQRARRGGKGAVGPVTMREPRYAMFAEGRVAKQLPDGSPAPTQSPPDDATGQCLSGPERCNGPSESLAAVLAMPWRPRVSVVAKFDFPPLGSRTSPSLACRRPPCRQRLALTCQ